MATSDLTPARVFERPSKSTYRRSTGSPRGEVRRQQLLGAVAEDLALNGLVDFSLRRAARAAETTHKVLLYYFEGADDLLQQAVLQLRERRIDNALFAAGGTDGARSLADRVRRMWPVLIAESSAVLEQAIGLAMFDPARHANLARDVSQQYLASLVSICPRHWSDQRRLEVAEMILAVLRGFVVEWRTSEGNHLRVDAGFEALVRALDREESASG